MTGPYIIEESCCCGATVKLTTDSFASGATVLNAFHRFHDRCYALKLEREPAMHEPACRFAGLPMAVGGGSDLCTCITPEVPA